MKKFNLVMALLFVIASVATPARSAHAQDASCDLSAPAYVEKNLAVISKIDCKDDSHAESVAVSICLDKLAELSKADPLAANSAHCTTPRSAHLNTNCGGHFHGGYKNVTEYTVELVQNIPVSLSDAMKTKCSKITACILGSNDADYIVQVLRPLAQSLQCE